jgi:SnoaL-like domain
MSDRIALLYQSFQRLDGDAMADCYADDATFNDPAFSLRGRREIGGMWRMFTTAIKKAPSEWRLDVGPITTTTAHWEPYYRFSATKRMVHNVIDSTFRCNAEGLIVEQRDVFDFWRWSRQALGAPGWALGWSPILRNKVRAQAASNLHRFLST